MRPLNGLLALLLLTASPLSVQTMTIANATVVDVSTGTLHPGTTVVIDANRIVSVGPAAATVARGQVVDAKGLYLIPGLWDMHTQAYFGWSRDFGDSYVLPLFIANGVTGIRDMGSDLDAVLRARAEVAAHRLVGPRMVVSGPMLDGPKATYKASIPIATPDDGRKAGDTLKDRGVDFIKIQSGVPHDAYLAIAAEAKARGVEFEGHVPDAIRASEAIAAGQRTFEHPLASSRRARRTKTTSCDDDMAPAGIPRRTRSLAAFLDRYDPTREAALIHALAANTIWQCPTLLWEPRAVARRRECAQSRSLCVTHHERQRIRRKMD